jgi:hypothetical protein
LITRPYALLCLAFSCIASAEPIPQSPFLDLAAIDALGPPPPTPTLDLAVTSDIVAFNTASAASAAAADITNAADSDNTFVIATESDNTK